MLQSYAGVILEKIDAKCNEIFLFITKGEATNLPETICRKISLQN